MKFDGISVKPIEVGHGEIACSGKAADDIRAPLPLGTSALRGVCRFVTAELDVRVPRRCSTVGFCSRAVS